MFKYQIHALAMRKLGFRRPLAYLALATLLGCVVAGAIYFVIVLHGLEERSRSPHVHPHSTH
jgi:hypothetical protein